MTEYIVDFGDERSSAFVRLAMAQAEANGARLQEEIVRCRDCRHMRTIDLSVYYGEHKHDLDICTRIKGVQLNAEPDGFCAWPERKEVDE